MFDVFGEVKKHISTSGKTKPTVKSGILSILHLCMLVSIFGCVMVTARNFIGDNINCVTDLDEQEHKAVENYCFITGTFTVPYIPDENSAHPGVGPVFVGTQPNPIYKEANERYPYRGSLPYNALGNPQIEEVQVHAYYQWVPIMLALQAGLYYLPVMLWKYLDRDLFQTTLCQLNLVHIDPSTAEQNIAASSEYFRKTLRHHNAYVITYLMAEASGVAIAISNLFITNAFLGGFFFYYGPAAIDYLNTPTYDFANPLNEIFPKVAKCTWHKYGPTGTIQTFDSLCVLPLNIVNEKTYIFLWICYVTAAAVIGSLFLLHLIIFFIPKLRENALLRRPMQEETRQRLKSILAKGNLGDWFLIWNYKAYMMYFPEWVKAVYDLLNQ